MAYSKESPDYGCEEVRRLHGPPQVYVRRFYVSTRPAPKQRKDMGFHPFPTKEAGIEFHLNNFWRVHKPDGYTYTVQNMTNTGDDTESFRIAIRTAARKNLT